MEIHVDRSSDNNISSKSSSFEQRSSSEDIVSSKGPSKALLKWYDDIKDEDILGFMFSKSGDKKIPKSKEANSNSHCILESRNLEVVQKRQMGKESFEVEADESISLFCLYFI
ncbi:hypothetical protein Tco_1285244 [Tanacetum coccineum]